MERPQMLSYLLKSMVYLKRVARLIQASNLTKKAAALSIIVLFAMEQFSRQSAMNGKTIKDGKYTTTDLFQELHK